MKKVKHIWAHRLTSVYCLKRIYKIFDEDIMFSGELVNKIIGINTHLKGVNHIPKQICIYAQTDNVLLGNLLLQINNISTYTLSLISMYMLT